MKKPPTLADTIREKLAAACRVKIRSSDGSGHGQLWTSRARATLERRRKDDEKSRRAQSLGVCAAHASQHQT
jgi:hypothetical protein